METMTITEALAELKTIGKRLEKKRSAILGYVARQEGLKDPLEKQGGSVAFIARERQAIGDLERRHLDIRVAIQRVNHVVVLDVMGRTATIAEWLTWRKEIAEGQRRFCHSLREQAGGVRLHASKHGNQVVPQGSQADLKPTDYIVNIDEAALAAEAEHIETMLGRLDGLLSLKNATTTIEV